jgi:hypothetical protein
MPAVTISAASVPGLATGPVRLHARVAASKVAAAAALANRELRRSPLFLVSFYPRQLRPDKRPMNRTLFNFRGRFLAGCNLNTFGLTRFGLRDIRNSVVVGIHGVCDRIFDGRRGAEGRSVLWDFNSVRS